ncbi:MAG: hypothetical protein OSB21_02095, partial [Myxococcota bacterium]|nr:hypothetical protein [Myxococcota bacterium]
EKEDLPPVAGVGHSDLSCDPLEQWKARQAARVEPQSEAYHIMPAVEAMPGWEGFVGWVAPQRVRESVAPVQKAPLEQPKEPTKPEQTLDLSQLNLSQIVDEVRIEEPQASAQLQQSLDSTLDLGDLTGASISPEVTLDLGNLDMEKVVRAAADSVPEPEPALPERSAGSAAVSSGLSPKLASVAPLAHPGRLPKGFALSPLEKAVLRACDGRRTTQAIHDANPGLSAADLSDLLKRCARIKLVTFKSASL